jgi:hypothetical protein
MKTKDFDNPEYWDLFGRGLLLDRSLIPTPKEVADYVGKLRQEIKTAEKAKLAAEHETVCLNQQFEVFLNEVHNVARKYRK